MKRSNVIKVGSWVIFSLLFGSFILFTSCGNDEDEVDIPVSSITVKGDFITDGGTSLMTAVVLPEEATNKDIEWEVSNELVAIIDQTGLLTAVTNGIVTVRARAMDESGVVGSKSINVSGVAGPQVLVESISIQASNIADGQPQQLSANVLPSNATNSVVIWSVSDETVAEISEEGLLTPLKNETVTITAMASDASGISDSKQISISGVAEVTLVTSITIVGSDITDGGSQQLSANIQPENADNKDVSWSVSNESVASINEEGILTPLQNGSVLVTAIAQDGSEVEGELTVNISGVEGIVVSTPAELLSAISNANAGDLIYVHGGTYEFNSTISLSRNGTSGNLIRLIAHPADVSRPLFDFSGTSTGTRGMSLSGNYWHIKGIDVFKAGDNGMFIRGSNNLIEFCSFSENEDSGLQIGNGGANNTILNCDSYFNADATLENADGFAAKLDCGSGNKFIGCRAWNNLDDGWDGYLRGADNITTYYENCWAVRNGYLKNGTVGEGDGNGFKTGGSDAKDLKHHAEFRNCIAAGNVVDGFDHNSNRGSIIIYNSSAHSNGRNISFGTGNIAESLTIKNTLSFDGNSSDQLNATTTDITNNGWQDGRTTNSADFVSVDIDLLLSPRQADGSLPDIDYLHLVNGSDLIDAGVDVGLSFSGSAPDIGAFEKD